MGKSNELLKAFYKTRNEKSLKDEYKSVKRNMRFLKYAQINPFAASIDYKKGFLALKYGENDILSRKLLGVTAYFFENFSEEKCLVWTKNQSRIKQFFTEGIDELIAFGGTVKSEIDEGEKYKLTNIISDSQNGDVVYTLLTEYEDLLTKMGWTKAIDEVSKIVKERDEISKEKQFDEYLEKITCMDLPLDWENAFANDSLAEGVFAQSISDGLVMCLNNLGRVDIEYISQITGESCKSCIEELRGSIYQNPDTWEECFYKGWETSDEYLSGRVLEKLRKVKKANRIYKGYFRDNESALEKLVPNLICGEDIYVTLGSPWLPPDIVADFIEHLFGSIPKNCLKNKKLKPVIHDSFTGTWELNINWQYASGVSAVTTYGTNKINALEIIERTLNQKSVTVTKTVSSNTTVSGKKRQINRQETVVAMEKQQLIIKEFQSWVWKNEGRKKRLEKIFNERFGSTVVRHYDGSFLKFPEMNDNISLFDYQKNAVARIMFSPNTLLAHDVGSGKTYIMIASGMEMRRIGKSRKNMYVVPNNIIGQWESIFKTLYPDAKLLIIEPKTFTASNRKRMLEKVKNNEYDGIIVAYSCFEKIKVGSEFKLEQLQKELIEIEKISENDTTSFLKKRREKVLEEICKCAIFKDEESGMFFEDLGINTLFVDEAHNYKNLPITTCIDRVMGINKTGSKKCEDMLNKVRCVQKQNFGRGVVFATGTPITNSITDIFVIQKYLQYGELKMMDIHTFDSWAGMFAEKKTEFEIDVDTLNYRLATRFSAFHNLPELTNILAAISDFHAVDKQNGLPDFDGYTDNEIKKTFSFGEYLEKISHRAELVRAGKVSRHEDNMLKITGDGRKAALDLRLVDKNAVFTTDSKLAACGDNIVKIYFDTMNEKSTQIVFCDISTPKAGFNMYDEIKEYIVKRGVDIDHVEYIHDANTEAVRSRLFEKMRNGETRVLIGSTFKLGIGVNVQTKLKAIHHLDVPWRPSDMVQREGRILRQGNTNKKVLIYRYVTKGSFDAYSWQLLETKQRFITDILSGSMAERSGSDVYDTVLNYAEVKALAIGNPLIKRRVEVANDLRRNILLQKKLTDVRNDMQFTLERLPQKIEKLKKTIESCERDIAVYEKEKREYTDKERKQLREMLFNLLESETLSQTEKEICTYQGFKIILPANMTKQMPFVYIEGEGRYTAVMSDAKAGILVRIDHVLDSLEQYCQSLKNRLYEDETKMLQIKQELARQTSYTDIIDALKNELEKIDKQLKVGKE